MISRRDPDPAELAAAHDPDLAARQQHWLDHHRTQLEHTHTGVLAHAALASDEAYD